MGQTLPRQTYPISKSLSTQHREQVSMLAETCHTYGSTQYCDVGMPTSATPSPDFRPRSSVNLGPTPWIADYSSLKGPVMRPSKRTLRPPMPPCCREPPGLLAPPPSQVVPHPPRLGTIALSNVPPCRALHPRHSLLPEASLLLPPSPPRGGGAGGKSRR